MKLQSCHKVNNSIVSLANKNSEGKVSSVHYTDFHPGYTGF